MKKEFNIHLALSHCPICSAISNENLLNRVEEIEFQRKKFQKGEAIAHQGDPLEHLYILTRGSIRTKMASEGGEEVEIEIIKAPKPFASAFLFAEKNTFPVEIEPLEECEVIIIPKSVILELFQADLNFLQRFLSYNANRAQFLSQRLQILTIKSIKGKIAYYLLDQLAVAKEEDPHSSSFQMRRNQTQLAAYFGVSRPALARAFNQLKKEGVIEAKGNFITVLNQSELRNILLAL